MYQASYTSWVGLSLHHYLILRLLQCLNNDAGGAAHLAHTSACTSRQQGNTQVYRSHTVQRSDCNEPNAVARAADKVRWLLLTMHSLKQALLLQKDSPGWMRKEVA